MTRYSWTQPICSACWNEAYPESPAAHEEHGEREVCCGCGEETRSGIYVRVDPANALFPSRLAE